MKKLINFEEDSLELNEMSVFNGGASSQTGSGNKTLGGGTSDEVTYSYTSDNVNGDTTTYQIDPSQVPGRVGF